MRVGNCPRNCKSAHLRPIFMPLSFDGKAQDAKDEPGDLPEHLIGPFSEEKRKIDANRCEAGANRPEISDTINAMGQPCFAVAIACAK